MATISKKPASALTKAITVLLNYDSGKTANAKRNKPLTAKERSAGSVTPCSIGTYKPPKGWTSQVGQLGGRPAIATYRKGRLKRAVYLGVNNKQLPDALIASLPDVLKWHGTRSNFRVVGQVRAGVFEAIAVTMYDDPTIITDLTSISAATASHNGFSTTLRQRRLNPSTKLRGNITVLTTTYPSVVRVAWFNRATGKVITKLKFDRI